MLQRINRRLEKLMPLITPVSVIIGVLLSVWLKPYTYLVAWIFGFMTFSGSLGSNFRDLKKVILHPLPLLACLVLLHVIIPLLAFAAGHAVFHGDIYTITGLLLAVVIPTGIISFMWVSIYRGNIALTLAIILVDTMLSPFLVPASLALFVGTKVHLNVWSMMQGLFWMIVFPSLLGMLLNQLTHGRVKEQVGTKLAPFSKIGLSLVVAINSSAVAPYLRNVNAKLVTIGVSVLLIASTAYLIGWWAAKLFNWDRGIIIALTFNTGMRNISSGTVLAITYFPPAVAVPVIIGTLFQQMLASFYGMLLHKRYGMGNEQASA